MKIELRNIKVYTQGVLLMIMIILSENIFSATLYAKQTGVWSNTSTWSGGALPKATDIVIVNSNILLTVDVANAVCSSFSVNNNTAGTASVSFNSGSKLTVSGIVKLSGNAAGQNGNLSMLNGGTLECGGFTTGSGTVTFLSGIGTVIFKNNVTIGSTAISTYNNLVINGGNTTLNVDLTINGNLTLGNSSTGAIYPQSRNIYIYGNWNHINPNNGFNEATSTVYFVGSTDQKFNCIGNFYNINVNKPSGNLYYEIVNPGNNQLNINNDLNIISGTMELSSSASSISVGRNLTIDGVLNLSGSNVTSLSVSGDVICGGTLDVSGSSITNPGNRQSLGGTFTMNNNGLLKIGRTNTFPSNYSMVLLHSTSTVNYSGSNQNVRGGLSYGNLFLSGTGTKTLLTNTNIAGNITVSGVIFNVTTNNTTITLNGSNKQELTGVDFYNLTINNSSSSNSIILNNITSVVNNLILTNGIVDAQTYDFVFNVNATVSGASNASHIVGNVKKITNATSVFIFPIGNGTFYRPIGIVSPSNDTWRASYNSSVFQNISSISKENSIVIDHVSSLEYWELSPANNGSQAKIMLSWNDNSLLKNPNTTVIAHWNSSNSYWENVGEVVADINTKTLTSANFWNTFSPFTLGSTVNDGALPIELIEFKAKIRK